MRENSLVIPIIIFNREIELSIFGEGSSESIIVKTDAIENGESSFQIKEGCTYEYRITDGFCLKTNEIVTRSKVNKSSGRICPNVYVGTLKLDILDSLNFEKCSEINLEVQSIKTSYREDYRHMLEEITDKCHDLLLQHSSLTSQNFNPDYLKDPKTAYQRFAFVKATIDSIEFNDAVQKIILSPVSRWKESEMKKDMRSVKKYNNSILRQLVSSNDRIEIQTSHPLKNRCSSIPSKVLVFNKTETLDTPENRFIKHALILFQNFCSEISMKSGEDSRIRREAVLLVDKLEHFIGNSVFKEISTPTTLPLNSPVLQRKEGYREVLRVWLMFDLAAKLVWHGGEDVYGGNKRDVATLYEYWIFFKLLGVIKEVFNIEPQSINDLIKETSDGLGLQLKQGKYLPVKGIYDAGTRRLNVEFSYNRTFLGDSSYPKSGSWTKSMRPDYTLSIWPYEIDSDTAEKEELITHIHFDAKYKVENIRGIIGNEDDFKTESEDISKGTFKRIDLLKMHTYKDAIRRTAGSYVLYPGTDFGYSKMGFHEIIPGLGAFSLRPSKIDNGTEDLVKFLNKVVNHFLNRASQREKMSSRTFEIYKDKNPNELNELLPETYGRNRNLIPDETYVLVAFYKKENLNWIINRGLFNVRADDDKGSLRLSPGTTGAKYLLLHSENETITDKLLKIMEVGPRVFSRQTLIDKGYPSQPSRNYYLVYKVVEVKDAEFLGREWDIRKLAGYKRGRGSSLPFSVTLTDLMHALTK